MLLFRTNSITPPPTSVQSISIQDNKCHPNSGFQLISARYSSRFIADVAAVPLRILPPPQRPVNALVSPDGGVEREAERTRREVDGAVQEVDGPGEHVHRRLVQLAGRELKKDFTG